jgi:hypothetical protein
VISEKFVSSNDRVSLFFVIACCQYLSQSDERARATLRGDEKEKYEIAFNFCSSDISHPKWRKESV